MESTRQVEQDLAFVRASIARMERQCGIPAIYLLWAVLIPVGFALPDLAPRWAGPYWAVAGPAGGVTSWLIGWFTARGQGVVDRRIGRRYALHWGILGMAFLLVALPGFTGLVPGSVMGAYMLLIAGTGFLLTSVHLEPGMAPSGVLMLAGFAVLVTGLVPWAWTLTGLLVAAALVFAALRAGRDGDPGATA